MLFSGTRPTRIRSLVWIGKTRRIPYIGDQAADDDDETATLIDSVFTRWDNRDKVKTFPELVKVVKQRYAVLGLTFPSTISVEELEALERPSDVQVKEGKLRQRSHSERRGDKEPPRAKAQMPGARPTSGIPTGTGAASEPPGRGRWIPECRRQRRRPWPWPW